MLASLPGLWVEGGWLTLVTVVVALLFGLDDDLLRGTLVGKRLTCLVRWCATVNNEREVFSLFWLLEFGDPPSWALALGCYKPFERRIPDRCPRLCSSL